MICEPNFWKNPNDYYLNVLKSDWYKLLVKLQNLIFVETMKFYEQEGLSTIFLPITTGSISSPMDSGKSFMENQH